jgi:hypothetical protein
MTEMGPKPRFRAYEWIDDQDLPVYVSYGPYEAPWRPLWERRHVDGSRIALWLRSLPRPPEESTKWLPVSTPLRWREAKDVARARVRQIAEWAGSWPNLPPWYFGEHHWTPPAPRHAARPVMRISSDGTIARFRSIRAAARGVGVDWMAIAWRVCTGCMDCNGCTWFDDFAGYPKGD